MADDLIQEVEEEQRLLRLRAVALRVGAVLLAVLVLAGLGGGVWAWRQHGLHEAQARASSRYFAAMRLLGVVEGGEPATGEPRKKAEALLADLSSTAPQGVRGYAASYLAELKAQDHDMPAALRLWQQVQDDGGADASLRAMARYAGLNARMGTAPKDVLRQGYQALVQEGGSWAQLAREGLAVLDLSAGAAASDHAEARRLLVEVQASPDSPEALRQRAGMMLQTLGDAG